FSISSYNKMWADAQKDLDNHLQREREEFLKPEKDPEKVFKMLTTSYIKYMQIFRNLETAYDQLVHQQKRAVIRKVLDGVMGRILEIKKEMVELENSEFHYIDNILADLAILPEDLEVPIPRYFIKERLGVLQQREKMLDQILVDSGLQIQKPVKTMTIEEATRVIQVAERARQGRCRAAFMKQLHLQDKKQRQTKRQAEMGPSPDAAATCIQKIWCGYIQRKRTEKMREEEMIFLGMSPPPHLMVTSDSQMPAEQVNALQSEVEEKNEELLQERNEDIFIKDKLKEMEGIHIKETLQDQIGQCLIECRHIIGRFPDYPTDKAGGSKAILSEKTPEQILEELEAKKMMALQEKDQKGKNKEGEKEKAKGKTSQKNENKEEGWKMAPSNFLSIMEEGNDQYKVFWQNRDEGRDFHRDHDPELIKEEKREEVEEEIRVQVDELMQQKLQNLKLVVDGEQSGKQKKGRKSEKVRAAVMSLVCRTIDSLYRELVEKGLIIKAKTVKLSDYVGAYSYLGSVLRQADIEPMPSLADVRQLIALYGILPLGSQTVHEKAPLVKGLLLAGPTGVGKKMLVHAICTETGANLFNLSTSNIAGKYPGQNGLRMMFHMVLKVGKQLQPSVVWIGDTEKIFSKAGPKSELEVSPKWLASTLAKFLKALKAQDRVLLVGTTTHPFDANLKPFCEVYKKIILMPRPDYSSRFGKYFMLWKHIILQNGGTITNLLNISCLAKLSDGYTPGHIVQAVQAVLSELRILQMKRKPLMTEEFVASLATQDPVYKEEEQAFK
ncbi:DRC11 protein, partial [Galbula dea]|nr:DRC11 protein [Galbula dea]